MMYIYGPHGRPRPKREIIQKLDALTATRNRLVKVRKIRTADAVTVSIK